MPDDDKIIAFPSPQPSDYGEPIEGKQPPNPQLVAIVRSLLEDCETGAVTSVCASAIINGKPGHYWYIASDDPYALCAGALDYLKLTVLRQIGNPDDEEDQ